MADGHISPYQLTIEKGTAFYLRHQNGEIKTPPEAIAAELYDITQELTAEAGYLAYEISNHAQPGKACRHNLSYWRYEDYVGIGPGAHGRLQTAEAGARAPRRHAKPETWLDAEARGGHGTADEKKKRGGKGTMLLQGAAVLKPFQSHFGAILAASAKIKNPLVTR